MCHYFIKEGSLEDSFLISVNLRYVNFPAFTCIAQNFPEFRDPNEDTRNWRGRKQRPLVMNEQDPQMTLVLIHVAQTFLFQMIQF